MSSLQKLMAATMVFAGLLLLSAPCALAATGFGTGSYNTIRGCTCSAGDQLTPKTVQFSFNFTVDSTGPCEPATGTITLADAGCKVRLKGKITHVANYAVVGTVDGSQGTAIVYGVVTSGKLKGEFFKLEVSGGQFAASSQFAFKIVSALCVDDCPGYITETCCQPPGTIFLDVFP